MEAKSLCMAPFHMLTKPNHLKISVITMISESDRALLQVHTELNLGLKNRQQMKSWVEYKVVEMPVICSCVCMSTMRMAEVESPLKVDDRVYYIGLWLKSNFDRVFLWVSLLKRS